MRTADTPLAREVQAIMTSGKLVPDDVTFRMVEERTSRADCGNGYILDGYPRTAVQAEQLESLAGNQGMSIQAIEVDVPDEELMKRLTGRRNCPVCNEIYNIYYKPPRVDNVCDLHPDAALNHRADDYPETVGVRLATYRKETAPLLGYYKDSGRLSKVDGTGDIEEIYKAIEKVI
jgi:adenylate kinase